MEELLCIRCFQLSDASWSFSADDQSTCRATGSSHCWGSKSTTIFQQRQILNCRIMPKASPFFGDNAFRKWLAFYPFCGSRPISPWIQFPPSSRVLGARRISQTARLGFPPSALNQWTRWSLLRARAPPWGCVSSGVDSNPFARFLQSSFNPTSRIAPTLLHFLYWSLGAAGEWHSFSTIQLRRTLLSFDLFGGFF